MEITGSFDLAGITLTAAPPPPAPAAWTTGANMNSGRESLGAAGTITATLGFAGYFQGAKGPGALSQATEEYDGSSWSSGGNYLTVARNIPGAGTQTAGLGWGGLTTGFASLTDTGEYDGTSWSSGGSLGSGTYAQAGCGTQTAALGVGGVGGGSGGATMLYDGSSWSVSGSTLGTAREQLTAFGTQSSAAITGGFDGSFTSLSSSENWNGSTWSSSGTIPTATAAMGSGGSQSNGISFGGNAGGATAASQTYDGSAWTTVGSISTARYALGGAGVAGTGIAFGGGNGGYPNPSTTDIYA